MQLVTPPRARRIAGLALPIVGGMVSQNVLNLVDTAMVGALGPHALAGVGVASYANFMAIAAITGMGVGVQAMAARRKGEGNSHEMAIPLNGGLVLAFVISLPLSVVLIFAAGDIMAFLTPAPAVTAEATPYYQARLAGMAAVGMNFAFRGYWNGVDLGWIYMRTLIVMHTANVVISYVLIFGIGPWEGMGTVGAGLGTTIALYLGFVLYVVQAWRRARPNGFMRRLPRRERLIEQLRLTAPAGLQLLIFATGMTTMFKIVGLIGTVELAAATVLMNLVLVAVLPGMAMGMAAATLVGQALGRREPDDAEQWGWDVGQVGAVIVGVIGLPMLLAPEVILSAFLHDPETMAVARLPLQIVGVVIALDAAASVLMSALQGAGETKVPLYISSILQWLIFLPAAYVMVTVFELGLVYVWSGFLGYRVCAGLIYAIVWRRGHWRGLRI